MSCMRQRRWCRTSMPASCELRLDRMRRSSLPMLMKLAATERPSHCPFGRLNYHALKWPVVRGIAPTPRRAPRPARRSQRCGHEAGCAARNAAGLLRTSWRRPLYAPPMAAPTNLRHYRSSLEAGPRHSLPRSPCRVHGYAGGEYSIDSAHWVPFAPYRSRQAKSGPHFLVCGVPRAGTLPVSAAQTSASHPLKARAPFSTPPK